MKIFWPNKISNKDLHNITNTKDVLLAFLSIVPQVYPLSFISFSMVRLHVVFGLPLFLFPSGDQA
jgi:hypothetical protein